MENIIKLHLGCGDEILDGYINCDVENIKADMLFNAAKIPFPDNSIDEIKAYHLIEHFKYREAFTVLKEWYRVLKPNGVLIMETPDLLNSCQKFVDSNHLDRLEMYAHFFSTPDLSPAMTHYFLYTEKQMEWTLNMVGFRNVQRVEPDSSHAKRRSDWKDIFLKIIAYKI